jgi:large subunit ribosomal protein L29
MAEKKTTKAAAVKTEKSKKAVKATEVKTLEQLREDLTKVQHDLQESRRSHRMGELVNPHVLTVQRKAVARALTAIKQAEIAAAKSETKEEN